VRIGFALTLLLLTASCKDEGVERHKQALEKYSACVIKAVPPNDPCFAEVLTILDTIPKSSSARPRADALRESLQTARQPRIRTPLAVQGGPHLPPEVVTQLQQCQRLAEQLGATPEADRPARLRELDACRAKAETLNSHHGHGDDADGGHAH
jgi:hypothetical protein